MVLLKGGGDYPRPHRKEREIFIVSTISTSSASTSARRASTTSVSSTRPISNTTDGRATNTPTRTANRRSPSKKATENAISTSPSSTIPTITVPIANAEDAVFNPLVAMQSVMAGDLVPIKQRSKAAQQLATYFCELPTTPSLYAYYEPYLPILVSVIVTPIKAAKDVQENVIKMLKALASHSPRQFVEWCALHVSMNPTQEPWYVDWCCGLLLAAETRVPRLPGHDDVSQGDLTAGEWDHRSIEYQEMEAATAAVFHVWRSVVDNADDKAIIYEIAVGMKTLLCYQPTGTEQAWHALITSKIQPHFVDMTDVLIGWAMSTSTSTRLRGAIFEVLEEMRELWIGNNVFCLQLLESFSSDIGSVFASTSSDSENFERLDSILTCSTLIARFVSLSEMACSALVTRSGQLGFVETLLQSPDPSRFFFSCDTIVRLSEFFDMIASANIERFAQLTMRAIRFLLTQVAHQVATRQCEMQSALRVLEKANGLAKTLSVHHVDGDFRLQAARLLENEVLKGKEDLEFTIFEVLLTLKYFAVVKYLTQIVIRVASVVGINGLQSMAIILAKKVSAGEYASTSFWVTTFVLVCKDPLLSSSVPDFHITKKIIETLISITQHLLTSASSERVGATLPCSFRIVPVFVTMLMRLGIPELTAAISELIVVQIRLNIFHLRYRVSDPTLLRDAMGSLVWIISNYPLTSTLPTPVQASIFDQLQLLRDQDAMPFTTEIVNLLVALAPRIFDQDIHTRAFVLVTEIMDEGEDSERVTLTTNVLPYLAPAALPVSNDLLSSSTTADRTYASRNVWEPSEMLTGDFERVYEMLVDPETPSEVWCRTCCRIHARMRRNRDKVVYDRSTLIRAIVCEAAKWVVQNRLRSPLGPPSAIFSGVERILHTQANLYAAGRGPNRRGRDVSAMMLVEFVLEMETLFGAATDIKCSDTNPDSDAYKVQTFFRANVAVCEEWLTRIRPALVELAARLKQSEALLHHSYAAITSLVRKLEAHLQRHPSPMQSDEANVRLMKYTIDLEGYMFVYAKSLSNLGDSDTITGLRVWWGEMLSRLMGAQGSRASEWEQRLMLSSIGSSWLEAIALQAELKYENAIESYQAFIARAMITELLPQASIELILHPLLSPIGLSLNTLVGCVRECGRCLVSLNRWGQLRALSVRCQQFANLLSTKWGNVPPLGGLMELCEAWKTEEPLIGCFLGEEPLLTSHSNTSCEMAADFDGRALASLEKWGALSVSDRLNAENRHPDLTDVTFVAECIQSLRFRPRSPFPDTYSPTSMRARESALLLASLISAGSDGHEPVLKKLQITARDGMKTLFDPTQWSRLCAKPTLQGQPEMYNEWLLTFAHAGRKLKNYVFAGLILEKLHDQVANADVVEPTLLALLYEKAVLKMASESRHDGVLTLVKLCDFARHSKAGQGSPASDTIRVRALLRLARTLASVTTGEDFNSIEAVIGVLGPRIERSANKGLVEYRDNVVMICLESATQYAPANPQTWYEYSKWCHQQGRQCLDKVISNGGFVDLLPSDEVQLDMLSEELRSDAERDDVRAVFKRVMDEGSLLSNREERLRRALSGYSTSGRQDLVNRFVSLQSRVVSRLLRPIKDAAAGYRSFLLSVDVLKDNVVARRDNSRMISVALRLLRMLTRFGSESDVVQTVSDMFTSGPLVPWCRVVPQLLSRIGHSFSDVSKPVAALLVRLASHYPHLVVYPAVVEAGRQQGNPERVVGGKKMLNDVLSELRRSAPELVDGVGRMVDELKRISVLWDDAWISALVKMSGDVNRRISTLDKEANRLERNSSLSTEEKDQLARRKAVAIMTPVLVAIERLWIDTLGRAMPGSTLTPHEKQFVHKYGSKISAAIQVFRGYCSVIGVSTDTQEYPQSTEGFLTPSEVWQPFADLLNCLVAAVGRRERINLAEISPILSRASHKSKSAPMPGVFSPASFNVSGLGIVTVSEVNRSVAILRTKTKPKCLKFVGSDGQGQRYLLKAREDLRLDERIMQFLETVNEFLRADRVSSSCNLRARNYSVVPLSSDAGLIQIVPDVLPLFQIYTSRIEDSGEGATTSGSAAASAAPADIEDASVPLQQPPTAPFYAKLKQYGIQDVAPSQRSRWPLAVLRRVHDDLVSARPLDVIAREIAAQSADFADAWTKKYRFARSTAVMSVLGYLVGLGDRHLDNMLLCIATGELLHIDYNVCFDKGRKLKVPELVPFRLTPIMVDALGLNGVDGTYRRAFVNTLRVVRDPDSREALLALLDAFVYDPLVDWVVDGRTHIIPRDTKQRMDVNVNLSLFLSRARERSQETTSFLKRFKDTSSSLARALAQTVELVGHDLVAQCRDLIHDKNIADAALSETQRDLAELKTRHPEEEVAMNSALHLVEGSKTKLVAFAKQCYERHQHVIQMHLRLSKFVPGARIDFLPQARIGGHFTRAHRRVASIATQIPVSPSTSVWMSMLTSLEARCSVLDEQISAITEQCDRVVNVIAPTVQAYMVRRGGELAQLQATSQSVISSRDIYGDWYAWCTRVSGCLDRDDYVGAFNVSCSIINDLDNSGATVCNRQRHIMLISDLEEEINRLNGVDSEKMETYGLNGDVETILHEFLSNLSALKLSNSQTHRVIKLVNTRWILSSLACVERVMRELDHIHVSSESSLLAHPLMRTLYSVSRISSSLRVLAMTPKGSLKKVITEMQTSEPRIPNSETDWVHSALENIWVIIDVLDSIFADCMNDMVYLQFGDKISFANYGVSNGEDKSISSNQNGSTGSSNSRHNLIIASEELWSALAGRFQGMISICNRLGVHSVSANFDTFRKNIAEAMQCRWGIRELEPVPVARRVSVVIAAFASASVTPVLRELLRHVVCKEWGFTDVFDSNMSSVDSLALDAMPSQPSGIETPLSGFHLCCDRFENLWSIWSTQSADEANSGARQRRLRTITAVLNEHKRHVDWLDWSDHVGAQENLTRNQLLHQLSLVSPTFPQLFEDMGHAESNLLEVAQQLEYVASQISFSCTVGMTANEVELQAICRDLRDLYSQLSCHFDMTREMSDVALGVTAIEASMRRICRDSMPSPLEMEVDQVGRSVVEGVMSNSDQLVKISNHSANSEISALKVKIEAAQKESKEASSRIEAQKERLLAACSSLGHTELRLHLTTVLQQMDNMAELMRSLGVREAQTQTELEQHSDVTHKLISHMSFVLVENDRLVRILHRSVESVPFMQELNKVLLDHDQNFQQLQTLANTISKAVASFCDSAQAALGVQDIPRCVLAISELTNLDGTHQHFHDAVLAACKLVEVCCLKFSEAAQLADELTKAEDLAPNLDGATDQPGNETGSSDDNGVEDLELPDDDAPTTANVPLRPLAGFQEQNRYGMDAVSRIDEKLGGVVVESGSRDPLSIEDQSSWLIRAATNVDNLCVMYEGWTPWI